MLDRDSIAELVLGPSPLLEEYVSLDQQLQPNGFDLSLREVARLTSPGSMGQSPDERRLSDTLVLQFDPEGWLHLPSDPYLVTFNEIVRLPLDLMALGRPRSSLLRCGVSLHTAVWDAGYQGRSQALLVVHQQDGYRIQQRARLMQLVFFRLAKPASQGYQGRFLHENLSL